MRTFVRQAARWFPGARGQGRSFSLNLVPVMVVLVLSLPFIGHRGSKIQMQTSQTTPAAKATLNVARNAKNQTTELSMKVKHLAPAASLSTSKNDYVVWLKPANHALQKEGVLDVKSDRSAEFKTTTPYKHFELFVTAEDSPSVQAPHGTKVLSAQYPAS